MPSRRSILRSAGSAVALGSSSGCLGWFRGGGVGIRIDNGDDRRHDVGVRFESGGETAFNHRYAVSAGEETRASDVVGAGEYRVTVDLGSAAVERVDFHMGGCDSNALFVSIGDGGGLDAGVLDEC